MSPLTRSRAFCLPPPLRRGPQLENLAKPVILTGSQVPFERAYNDARRNLVVSVMLAGTTDIPEVAVFFSDQLMRGNRTVKLDNAALSAFHSPNFPPLAKLSTSIVVNRSVLLPVPRGRFHAHLNIVSNIAVLRLVPGFDDDVIESMTTSGSVRAIVLMLYGTGNAPGKKSRFISAIRHAVDRGVVVVAVTQCLKGSVELDAYAVGASLKDAGVLACGDMTCEATTAKLGYLLSLGLDSVDFATTFRQNLRGEMSPPPQRSSGGSRMSRARRELNIRFTDKRTSKL